MFLLGCLALSHFHRIFNRGCGGTGKDVFCWSEHSPAGLRHPPAPHTQLGTLEQDSPSLSTQAQIFVPLRKFRKAALHSGKRLLPI